MILAFAGGVGGARFAHGLAQILDPGELIVAVNTGDDFVHLGLHVSPDLDTVMYTLAGINDPQRGWGVVNETWHFMEQLGKLGGETWFQLGDRDLATNVERTRRLAQGESLSEVTRQLCQQLGVRHNVVPMSNESVRTRVQTDQGELNFQDYFVRRRAEPAVCGFVYAGAGEARMSPALQDCFSDTALNAIIICPSNPYLSIAPILSVSGVREAMANAKVPRLAISPIVGGQALKGPAAKIMRELGKDSSVVEIARFYNGLIDGLVIDHSDKDLVDAVERSGVVPLVAGTIMRNVNDRRELADQVLQMCEWFHSEHAWSARS